MGQGHYVVMELGYFSRCNHVFFTSRGHPVSDVVLDGGVEQEDVLLDDTHVAAQRRQSNVPNVLVIDTDAALRNFVEPWQQIYYGRLAAAGGPQYGSDAPRRCGHIDVLQRWDPWVVREGHIFEPHMSLGPRHLRSIWILYYWRLGV